MAASGWQPFEGQTFNSVFLAYMLSSGILAIFFLLYFNRVVGSLVSWAFRTWSWHQYGIYLDIQALQVSLLGGRIFFTGLRYHGNNETILIQHGYLTWSYWLRRVRSVNLEADAKNAPVGGKKNTLRQKPCRINVSVTGVEWFVYNRSAAYEGLLAELMRTTDADSQYSTLSPSSSQDGARSEKRDSNAVSPGGGATAQAKLATGQPPSQVSDSDDEDGILLNREADEQSLPILLQLLPINLECDKAALVMGNENTRAILIVRAKAFTGEIDASATATHDPYRQIYRLKFDNPVIEMRNNEDFKEDLADRAQHEKQGGQPLPATHRRSFLRQQRHRLYHGLRNMIPFLNRSVESVSDTGKSRPGTADMRTPGFGRWQGLSRYLSDQDDNGKSRWASVEYAAVPTILETPSASLTVYWDAVGKVKASHLEQLEKSSSAPATRVNGTAAPAWGITLSIHGGNINYGPWADRQRAELQRNFFPGLSKDAVPAQRLQVGSDRVPTQFKLLVEFDADASIRVPIREESKNWRWASEATPAKAPDLRDKRKSKGLFRKSETAATQAHARPYGWLDIKIAANTAISYSMDMLAGPHGYTNTLDVDCPCVEMSSSINHEVLWRSGRSRISCDLSTPLQWNGLRSWRFGVTSDALQLFLLRDHIFLLIDLVDDWASGPPADYLVFTPFRYSLDLRLDNVKLFLNVNDANIVTNPTDLDDNTYVVISSPQLLSKVSVPIDRYRPANNAIPFEVDVQRASVDLHVPPWNTQAAFLDSTHIGHLDNLALTGKYHYNATTSPSNTDTLILNVIGQSPVATIHGFVIRYLMTLKDNYFGEYVHFKTLDEFQEIARNKARGSTGPKVVAPPPKKSNDLDVILHLTLDSPILTLPTHLYASDQFIRVDAASATVDLRFTNYYMDLDLVISPLSLAHGDVGEDGVLTAAANISDTQLFLDGLHIYGHRVFGLPPTEPTYVCNWDVDLGACTGQSSPIFLTRLISAVKAFAFTFDDDENALIPRSSIVLYDVTFLRAYVASIELWIQDEDSAFLVSSGSVEVNYNDWARAHYSRRAHVRIPNIQLSCIKSASVNTHRSKMQQSVDAELMLQTSIHLIMVGRKANFTQERRLQQELIRREDQRTHRAEFLLMTELLESFVPDAVDPPAQCAPPLPAPKLSTDVASSLSSTSASSAGAKRSSVPRRKSSFLSFSSASSSSSVIRPQSSERSSRASRRIDGLKMTSGPILRESRDKSAPRGASVAQSPSDLDFMLTDSFADSHMGHNTVAFSSKFFEPYFPLGEVNPAIDDFAVPSIEQDSMPGDEPFTEDFDLGEIDPELLNESYAYMSIMIELPTGLSVSLTPASLKSAAHLVESLQTHAPLDVLDALQLTSMDTILSMQKDQKMQGRVTDFAIRLPHGNVRFIHSSTNPASYTVHDFEDIYEVEISALAVANRAETIWGTDALQLDARKKRGSTHFQVDFVRMSAKNSTQSSAAPQVAVTIQVEQAVLSLGARDLMYLDVDVAGIHSHMASESIDYLAGLFERTSALSAELGDTFSTVIGKPEQATDFVVYQLMQEGQQVADPSFLIRPSAVLRSAPHHLRTFDSWKMMSRLRQMWEKLPGAAKSELKLRLAAKQFALPVNAKERVLRVFERWRNWDLDDASEAVLFRKMFPKPATQKINQSSATALLAVVRLREVQLVLDPGPRQNAMTTLDLTVRAETHRELLKPQSGENGDDEDTCHTIVSIHCADATMTLNWELCKLAENALKVFNELRLRTKHISAPSSSQSEALATNKTRSHRSLHAVLVVGRGSVILETINLYTSSVATNLKASAIMAREDQHLSDAFLLVGCDDVTCKVRSHSQALSKFQLDGPSITVCREALGPLRSDSHTLKATASSKSLALFVRQDPVILLEVLDLLVRDEASHLYGLKAQLAAPPAASSHGQVPNADKVAAGSARLLPGIRINVAVFMDEYTIRIPLLRSMTYKVSGTVARAAMSADHAQEVMVDFDVKENSHEILVDVKNTPQTISLLQIPPTNGRVTSSVNGTEERLVTAFAHVELVQLDASAVYSLLSALNRPEIAHTVTDAQEQLKVVQSHLQALTGRVEDVSSSSSLLSKEGNGPAYAIHLTLTGLEIFGTTPLKSEDSPTAHTLFWVGGVHAEVTNRSKHRTALLKVPEVHLDLRHIHFGIKKGKEGAMHSCGNIAFGAQISAEPVFSVDDGVTKQRQGLNISSDSFQINLSPDTVSTVVDILGFMGDKIKDLDTSRELDYLRRLRQSRPRIAINDQEEDEEADADLIDTLLSSVVYSMEIRDIQLAWLVHLRPGPGAPGSDDLIVSLQRIELRTRQGKSARLLFESVQVQLAPKGHDSRQRSVNSALLPEVVFNVAYSSTRDARRLAFQAKGQSLDLRLNSAFITPAAEITDSIRQSIQNAQQASAHWNDAVKIYTAEQDDRSRVASASDKEKVRGTRGLLGGSKRLESLLLDAAFDGAVVHMTGRQEAGGMSSTARSSRSSAVPGRFNPVNASEATMSNITNGTVLYSPGLAWKIEYRESGSEDPSLYGEVKIDASSNILYPAVVPLIMDMSSSVKEIVRDKSDSASIRSEDIAAKAKSSLEEQSNILTRDPTAVLGRLKLNLGLRICRQEFSLSCQPIARVAATASFEDVYFTVNTVRSADQGSFFAVSGTFSKLQASVKHVYSRDSTGSFEVDSIVLSLLNSKHVSGTSGVSAILKVSPTKIYANVRQLQDFLLFREIWFPDEVRHASKTPIAPKLISQSTQSSHLVQRYQQVAATAAFPWTATIAIAALEINLDLGQSLGKSVFAIKEFWVSSKKTSDWEQNLCLGFERIGVDSTGRMSGFVALQDFQLRTLIKWPEREQALNETPMIQASIGFTQLRLKVAFDYQPFVVADITSVEFLMYNVRRSLDGRGDRLVAIFDGDAVQVMGTTTSAAQAVALYQAFQKLAQESKANYAASLREIEKFLKRRATDSDAAPRLSKAAAAATEAATAALLKKNNSDDDALAKSPISLDTDVVVTLKALNLGFFPSSFLDHQVFKMEALDANARFLASNVKESKQLHSTLALTLGQLRIGLASVRETRTTPPAAPAINRALPNELSVEDVVSSSTGARGGTILRVPRVSATMETWQSARSRHIDYIFRSAFEGKVEVGWNYSRISYIRGMWANSSKLLAQAYGRELPLTSSIRVTGVPEPHRDDAKSESSETSTNTSKAAPPGPAEKITAEVNVPLSKYEYHALEPPVIETPQLRDMGEATPPLEWIGLHRDRLPNLTHQVVIVALLELAGEVEDAYERILGSS